MILVLVLFIFNVLHPLIGVLRGKNKSGCVCRFWLVLLYLEGYCNLTNSTTGTLGAVPIWGICQLNCRVSAVPYRD